MKGNKEMTEINNIMEEKKSSQRGGMMQLTILDGRKRDAITDMLIKKAWGLHCYMFLPVQCDAFTAPVLIRKWQKKLFETASISVGCEGIFNPEPRPYLNLLAIGHKKNNKFLSPEDLIAAEKCWHSTVETSIFIKDTTGDPIMSETYETILLQDTPSLSSVLITADFMGELQGEGNYNDKAYGSYDISFDIIVDERREVLSRIWAELDEAGSNRLAL